MINSPQDEAVLRALRAGRFSEAEAACRAALALNPRDVPAWLALADALAGSHQCKEAVSSLHEALKLQPFSIEAHSRLAGLYEQLADPINAANAWFNAGYCQQRRGDDQAAVPAYQAAVRLNPRHAKARHSLASLTGETTRTAPVEYVVDLFNQYADHFDEHLAKLKYEVPERLRAAVGRCLPPGANGLRVLDLGCGTGQCARAFRDLAARITGVDLAPKMIEASRRLGFYHALHQGDVTEFLRSTREVYDLILSADVFIYVGDLAEIFPAVAKVCAPAGRFAFSVEDADGESYVLRPSGRYAHAATYVEKLANEAGFHREVMEPVNVRLAENGPIPGSLYVFRRT